ncbi:MAG: phosphodiester glycosidase family protein, partial [Flavobacteriales bacterium]
ENGKVYHQLNTADGNGNFHLKPNGVFYLTKNRKAAICSTPEFAMSESIAYATQSGPMLIHRGKIHDAFKKGSKNLNIRNGVGILPDGKVVFAMSKTEVNFYDFAMYFSDLGCKDALYLDGFVSRTYLPSQNWIQTDGDFGVMIAVTEDMP